MQKNSTRASRYLPEIRVLNYTGKVALLWIGLLLLTACTRAEKPSIAPAPSPTPAATPTFALSAVVKESPVPPPTPVPTDSLTTVLLLGVDRRGPESTLGGLNNTDTLMLFGLDRDAQRIVIFSIPRDLYVDIPGHGQDRINTAYAYGKSDGTGGLAMARSVVSETLGVAVDHVVLVDFRVFVALVDAIGGVDVDVPYLISDPTYPDNDAGYDPFYLPAGRWHLDGATALKFARTRATPSGDFDRTARQRQVVMAMRDRVLQLDMLPTLVSQAPQLWAALQSAYETDLTVGDAMDLATIAGAIPTERIVTDGIDANLAESWVTPTGAQVLLVDRETLRARVAALFTPPAAAAAR